MNPAKAAPSAPVKKRPGRSADPPGRLAYPIFFFYLRWVRQFSAITNQHKKTDDQQDTGHADEHHGQGGHPGRKMKHKGTSVKSDALARRTLQNAKKEA